MLICLSPKLLFCYGDLFFMILVLVGWEEAFQKLETWNVFLSWFWYISCHDSSYSTPPRNPHPVFLLHLHCEPWQWRLPLSLAFLPFFFFLLKHFKILPSMYCWFTLSMAAPLLERHIRCMGIRQKDPPSAHSFTHSATVARGELIWNQV